MESPSYWHRFSTQRLSRRRALRAGAAGLGAATLALAGCGGEGEEAPTAGTPAAGETPTADGTPQHGGNVTFGLGTDPGGLDAHLCVTCFWVSTQFHGFLYFVNIRDQSMMPQMAEALEQPDDLTYIWKLKPGIKFHNVDPTWGREAIAEDVVYSFLRRRDDPASLSDKMFLKEYTDHFEATDKYTFRLVTKVPYAPAHSSMGDVSYPIVPREAVEKWGSLQQHAVGCGPYILEEFVRGERVKAARNPDYFMEGRPYLDSREWAIIPDQSTLLQAFRTGQHDYCGADLDKLKVEELEKTDGIVVRKVDNHWLFSVLFRVDRPPFGDERVWKAIDLAVDRQDMIDKLAFGEGKFCGPVSPDLEFWTLPQEELREFYEVDLTEARQLLSAAGYPDGLEADVPTIQSTGPSARAPEVISEHLAKIGVKWNIQPKELGVYLSQHLYPGNFDMTAYTDLPYTDPDMALANWFSKGQVGVSFTGYDNPEADEWVWKVRTEIDPEKRRELALDAQRFFIEEHGPVFNTYTAQGYDAYWDWLHGIDQNIGIGSWSYLGVDMWTTRHD